MKFLSSIGEERLGNAIEWCQHDATSQTVVRERKAEQFFGWVAGLGGSVRIDSPKSLKKEYNEYLKSLIEEDGWNG